MMKGKSTVKSENGIVSFRFENEKMNQENTTISPDRKTIRITVGYIFEVLNKNGSLQPDELIHGIDLICKENGFDKEIELCEYISGQDSFIVTFRD